MLNKLKLAILAPLLAVVMSAAPIAWAQSTVPVATPGGYVPTHASCAGRIGANCYPLGGIVFAEATNKSLVITTGGTAQDLMAANALRQGWEVQNQSADNCYWRAKGTLGTTVATMDQNSFMLAPGSSYTPPHISANAISIICPTTGDLIYAREW